MFQDRYDGEKIIFKENKNEKVKSGYGGGIGSNPVCWL